MARPLEIPGEEGSTPVGDLSGLLIKVRDLKELFDREAEDVAKAHAKYILIAPLSPKINLLSLSTLFDIHRDMFSKIYSWAGESRKTMMNIGVAPEKIPSEIHRLDYEEHHQWKDKISPESIAVRIHHRLVWIHPFENGNGRWARLVTNIYLRRHDCRVIHWSSDIRYFRPKYLAALKKADHGDFEPLEKLHAEYAGK